MYPLGARRQIGGMGVTPASGEVVITYETPSYLNRDGSGNRNTSGIVFSTSGASPMWGLVGTNAVAGYFRDGDFSNIGGYCNNGIDVAGEWMEFDFTTLRLVTEAKFYFSDPFDCGTFKWQAWDGEAWVDLESGATFVMGADATQIVSLSSNETGYRKYRILGVSGTSSWGAYWREIEFKIGEVNNAGTMKWKLWQTPAVLFTHDLDYELAYTIYTMAFPYVSARNIKSTAYVQTNLMGTVGFPTNAQLQEMYAAGWDVANHSVSHPLFTSLTQAQIEDELTGAQSALDALGFTRSSKHVAYPSGVYDADTLAAMTATGMLTGRPVSPSPQGFPSNLYEIGYVIWLNSVYVSLAQAKAHVDDAKAGNYVLIFLLHHFTEWAEADFQELVDYVIAQQVQPLTIDELYRLNTDNITVTRPVGW